MANDTKLKSTLDNIDGALESQLKFVLKALLLTERISIDMVDKAFDLSVYVRSE